jgi:hypothetical protein
MMKIHNYPQEINFYIFDYIKKVNAKKKAQKSSFIQVILSLAKYSSSGNSPSLTPA